MTEVDYSKIDPWIKKHPKAGFTEFQKACPDIAVSSWSWRKRQYKMLGIPLTPSMKPDYFAKRREAAKNSSEEETPKRRTARAVYTTIHEFPLEELKNKKGVDVLNELIQGLNKCLNLHLEIAQVSVIGTDQAVVEVRRHNR